MYNDYESFNATKKKRLSLKTHKKKKLSNHWMSWLITSPENKSSELWFFYPKKGAQQLWQMYLFTFRSDITFSTNSVVERVDNLSSQ